MVQTNTSILKKIHVVAVILSVLCLLQAVFLLYRTYNTYRRDVSTHRQTVQETVTKTVAQANDFINQLKELVNTTSARISEPSPANPATAGAIQKILNAKPFSVTGLGIVMLSPTSAPVGQYALEKDGKTIVMPLEPTYLTPEQLSSWVPVSEQRQEGFFGPIATPIQLEPSLIYAKKFSYGSSYAIVFATLSFSYLQNILWNDTIESLYWFITDQAGTIIMHPRRSLATTRTSFKDLAKLPTNTMVTQPNFITYTSELTGDSSWLFSQKLAPIDWTLNGVYDLQELPIDTTLMRHNLIQAILWALASFILFLGFFITWSTLELWITSALCTMAAFCALGLIWYTAALFPAYQKTITPLGDPATLAKTLATVSNQKNTASATFDQIRKYIPSGLYLKDITLSSPGIMEFVGLFWQRYTKGVHDGLSRGFIFPSQASKPDITLLSTSLQGNQETMLWEIRGSINQSTPYESFPFDAKELLLPMRHQDFAQGILLIPDLRGYQTLASHTWPGIAHQADDPEYRFIESFFGYSQEMPDTNLGLYTLGSFGISSEVDLSQTPDLTFVIVVARNLLQTLITDALPLCVIAFILFLALLSSTGLTEALQHLAAIFFATVIAHISFRGKVPPHEVVYFEIFFMIMYGAILAVSIVTVLQSYLPNLRFIAYRDSLIPKLLYWPLLLSAVLGVTVWYLY